MPSVSSGKFVLPAKLKISGEAIQGEADVFGPHIPAGGEVADGPDFDDRDAQYFARLGDRRALHRFKGHMEEAFAEPPGLVRPRTLIDGAAGQHGRTGKVRGLGQRQTFPVERPPRRLARRLETRRVRQFQADVSVDFTFADDDVANL